MALLTDILHICQKHKVFFENYRPDCVVIETSGSVSNPKKVVISQDAITKATLAANNILGIGQWFVVLPLNYIAGFMAVARSLVSGFEPIILFEDFQKTLKKIDQIVKENSNQNYFISLVPQQLKLVLENSDPNWFPTILVGGQKCPKYLLEHAKDLGFKVITSYGASETCGGCVYDGKPIGDIAIEIIDEIVEISGDFLALGYLEKNIYKPFEVKNSKRYWKTTDNGYIDDSGLLQIIGRIDNVMISGGLKLNLDEVKDFLYDKFKLIDQNIDVIATKTSDETWGESLKLIFAPIEDSSKYQEFEVKVADALIKRFGKSAKVKVFQYQETKFEYSKSGKLLKHGVI